MAGGEDAIVLLRSIDASLKALVAQGAKSVAPTLASDRDLDGAHGNPVVKFMPRDWTGENFKGRTLSECPPELLELLAETFDYFARKAEENNEVTSKDKPVAPYKRADAARARGWAARLRKGWTPTTPKAGATTDGEWARDDF